MEAYQLKETEIDSFFENGLFKVLGEPIRVRIVRFLAVRGSCDISTVAAAFPQDRSVISRHLKLLAECGLLRCSKEGRNTFYALNGFEFLRNFEAAAAAVRELLAKACPTEMAAFQNEGGAAKTE